MKFRQLMRATENKYNRLLANLVLLYIIYPFLVYLPLGDLLVFFFFSLSVIIAVYQIDRSKLALRCNIGLFLIALILRVFGTIIPIYRDLTGWFDLSSTLISLAFISLCVYSILQELILAEQVTSDIIKGGICVYFLLGFFWASAYNIVQIFDPDSFSSAAQTVNQADLLHFSFTTLATVGYGDIVPTSKVARVLANLEGMAGVLYPAVFIARLVSLHNGR
ncbi:potassium channel family protein [Microcystis sp. LEGE 08355]|uniref:potassium channel family protein n=1 Tax=Microcystis sp. LEGE 08355 TaxID=1828687 RepID=UPI001882EA1F|nr:potassium channel family protein [Microcystis sp. LEGE 08355]MBE9073555.1 two pore domain potassium channel family protein [Microcystis sp. LEGE 08355]